MGANQANLSRCYKKKFINITTAYVTLLTTHAQYEVKAYAPTTHSYQTTTTTLTLGSYGTPRRIFSMLGGQKETLNLPKTEL